LATVQEKRGKRARDIRKSNARWQRRSFLVENDLKGKIPPPSSRYKVKKYKTRLLDFLVECFPGTTGKKTFSKEQKDAIEMLEFCIMQGGRIAEAFPRGFAKTAILMRSCMWAMIYRYRRMIMLYSKSMDSSTELNEGVQTEFTGNSILRDLYPKICYPFKALGGSSHRASHQTFGGELTRINLKSGVIRLANIPGEPASGSMFISKPMSAARGQQKTIEIEGETIVLRPDFVAIDDPSDEEISASQQQTKKLVSLIKKGILRGGGHSKTLAAAMAVTVIEPKDCADQFLKDPSWQSLRIPMMKRLPSNLELWQKYKDIRHGFDQSVPGSQIRARLDCLEFYKENREEMDKDAEPTWEWAFEFEDDPQTEISAVQHAMNILLDEGPSVFNCECQNNPDGDEESKAVLKPESLMVKTHAQKRHVVPRNGEKVVAHVDLGLGCFWYAVGAFSMGYEGFLIDRETYPKQGRRLFAKSSLPHRLADMERYKGITDQDALIYSALMDLLPLMLETKYKRDGDNSTAKIDRIGVDCGKWTQVVYDALNDLDDNRLIPTKGYGSGKTKAPIAHRRAKEGERKGAGFLYKLAEDGNPRQMEIDTNERKSFLTKRLVEPLKSPTSFSFYHHETAEHHELLADHCCSEYSTELDTKWGDLSQWMHKHGRPDNDWWDNLVGVMALASFEGCEKVGSRSGKDGKPKPPEIDLGGWVNG